VLDFTCVNQTSADLRALDFMSIRKIPLKEQRYLEGDEGYKTSEDEEDPSTIAFQSKMRAFLLTDRAIHDQVMFHLIQLWSTDTRP